MLLHGWEWKDSSRSFQPFILKGEVMKAFKKWYNNEYKGSSLEEGTARAAWNQSRKEALEWALKQVQYDNEESDAADAIMDELDKLNK